MVGNCVRAVAAAWMVVVCGFLLANPWQAVHAAPIVFQKASGNGTSDDAGRFSAVLSQGSGGSQALLQLFTATDPGSRITGFYVQDTTGAVARDTILGGPLVRLSETQVHEVVLSAAGNNKVAVIKTLSDTLGITLAEAKTLADSAPTVIRTSSTSAGNDQLKQALESVGASVTLGSRQDPAVPAGTNVGVTLPGAAPTGYDVVLESAGTNKVAVIKAVRDLTGLGLTEAKQLVDNAPSVLKTNASTDDAVAARQLLQDTGATVALQAVGATPGQAVPLPPGSAGIALDFGFGFDYVDPLATPLLQLTLDLGVPFADLVDAWQEGQFLLGLRVTDASGLSDLYLAANDAVPPTEIPEPSTVALLSLGLLALLRGTRARRMRVRRTP